MTWRSDLFPPSALALPGREPSLAARLVGWREDALESLLVTEDAAGRFWLWRWETSPFVTPAGETLAGSGYYGAAPLWVPLFGPWERMRRASAADHMAGIVDLLG